MNDCDIAYQVRYLTSTGQTIGQPFGIQRLEYGRKLDDISIARITYDIGSDECCDILGNIEPLISDVSIVSNGLVEWVGTVVRVEYGRTQVEVEARDKLWWMTRRSIHNDMQFTNTDLSDIFIAVWNDATAPSAINATLQRLPTGVFESRTIKKSENRYAWNVMKEMLDSGLDVTVYGNTIIIGNIINDRPLQLRLADTQGDVRVLKDGMQYANRVIMDAGDKATATYPPGDPLPNDSYPLTEIILKDFQIDDSTSAENRAKARYEYSRYVPRIVRNQDSIVLGPNSTLKKSDLVPGVTVTVDTTGLCYAKKESFRIGTVDFVMVGGVETTQLGLQPRGPSGGLGSAEEPV